MQSKNVNKCKFSIKQNIISYFIPINNFAKLYVKLSTIIMHTIYLHSQLCKEKTLSAKIHNDLWTTFHVLLSKESIFKAQHMRIEIRTSGVQSLKSHKQTKGVFEYKRTSKCSALPSCPVFQACVTNNVRDSRIVSCFHR